VFISLGLSHHGDDEKHPHPEPHPVVGEKVAANG